MAKPQSHVARPAPPPDLSGSATHSYALTALSEELRRERPFTEHGQNGLTLVHRDDLTVVLSVADKGRSIEERRSPGTTLVMVLAGAVSIRPSGGEAVRLEAGGAMAFGPDATHEIIAEESSSIITVIGTQSS